MQQLLKDVVTADQAAHDAVARACLTDEDRHWLKSVTQSEELPLID